MLLLPPFQFHIPSFDCLVVPRIFKPDARGPLTMYCNMKGLSYQGMRTTCAYQFHQNPLNIRTCSFLTPSSSFDQKKLVYFPSFKCSRVLTACNGSKQGASMKRSLCNGISQTLSTCQFPQGKHVIAAWTRNSEELDSDIYDAELDSDSDDDGENVVSERSPKCTSSVGAKAEMIDSKKNHSHFRGLRWLLWLLGPSILLASGVVPTLWLPFAQLFEGSTIAGLLALAGLDGTFNLGASMFLLMADSCAQSCVISQGGTRNQLPLGYKIWSFLVNLMGCTAPFLALIASKKGFLAPEPTLLPLSAMLGPYLVLLLVQMFAEILVWQLRSPVWAVLPVVYDGYRVMQLTRGLQLGVILGATPWLIEAVKGLVAYWVFVLGMQLMWIAWSIGSLQN